MENKQKFLGIMCLIALRKTEFYNIIINKLSKEGRLIKDSDKKKIRELVSNMDNNIFISNKEKKLKKINPKLKIGDLKLNVDNIIGNNFIH